MKKISFYLSAALLGVSMSACSGNTENNISEDKDAQMERGIEQTIQEINE